MKTLEQRLDDFASNTQTDQPRASELIREAAAFIRAYTIDPDAPAAELVEYIPPADVLLDQGVTRLQLLAFLRGDESDVWNGSENIGSSRWVRYRAHQIDRTPTPDGFHVTLIYNDHDGSLQDADWTIGGTVEDAFAVLRMADFIIGAAIAHHGPDGVA